MVRLLIALGLFALVAQPLRAAPAAASPDVDPATFEAVARDLCPKRVVMLGEAQHGDGRTIAFKAALVRRLVGKCGFNAVFWEAPHYDFLELMRRMRAGEPTSPEMLGAAIGFIWRLDTELQPLIPFLHDRARAGRLYLGGLDDQVGSAGAFYSVEAMPAELAAHLAAARAAECAATLKRRAWWDYGDGRHYDEAERGRIRACLTEIAAALRPDAGPRADEHRELVADFERQIARDSLDRSLYVPERDRSMAENFRWLAARLPRGSKIIVWAATGHGVKAVTSDPDYQGRPAMGAWLRRGACPGCFTLGFSALSGATRYSPRGNETRPVTASAGSVEAAALAGLAASSVYLDGAALRRLGGRPGSFLGRGELTEDWSKALDGAVIFREQRPTGRADAPAAANGGR